MTALVSLFAVLAVLLGGMSVDDPLYRAGYENAALVTTGVYLVADAAFRAVRKRRGY